jgi:dipeptide/tripeptide permease
VPWKAFGVNLGAFAGLFAMHVAAASLEWDLMFRLVALSLTFQIFFFGPLTVWIQGAPSRLERRRTNGMAPFLALPLTLGLAWAYGGMSWNFYTVIVFVGISASVHCWMHMTLADDAPSAVGGLK